MNKIIKIALESEYPNIEMDALMEVINATGNPTVATEVLLSVYEPPILDEVSIVQKDKMKEVRLMKSFNKFEDRVYYSYTKTNIVTAYFKSQEDRDNATEYNRNMITFVSSKEKNDYLYTKDFEKVDTGESECKSYAWINNKEY